jgi:DNA-directed RNA polymerase specialized sigma24 family protein
MAQIPVDEGVEEWLPAGAADPERELERAELRTYLHRQIEKLPESFRLLVMLRYQQDLSYEEIADVTGMPLGSVKTGLFRAHARLKAALQAAPGSGQHSETAGACSSKGDGRPGVLSQPAPALAVGRGGGR